MTRPEIVVVQRVVESLGKINGVAPYETDVGGRIFVMDPDAAAATGVTPALIVGFGPIDPGETDGGRNLTITIEGVVGADFWEPRAVDPFAAIMMLHGDVQQALGVQHRDLVVDPLTQISPLYRGPNSNFSSTRFARLKSGGGQMIFALSWRYVYHEEGVNGP